MTVYKNIRSLLVVVLLAGCTFSASAQKVGTTSLQFLKVMPTARATAMGDAYVTLASGSDAVFWNPAGISIAPGQEISTTLTLWLFDTKQSAISYSLPLGDIGSVAAQFQYVDFGTIEETDVAHLQRVYGPAGLTYNPGLTGRTFSPKSYLFGLSYARNLTSKFSTGLSVKYAAERLFNDAEVVVRVPGQTPGTYTNETYKTNTSLILFDFGMLYNTGYHTVRIAASVQNFGPQAQFAKQSFPAPLLFRLGTSADLIGGEGLLGINTTHRITAAFDLVQPNDYLQQMHLGVEYGFTDVFAVRAGYKFNYDADGLTLGAGVSREMHGYVFGFDYSYGAMGTYLSNVHRLSLGVKFR